MPPRNLTFGALFVGLAVLAVVLVLRGQNAWAEHEKLAQTRTATEHSTVCGRFSAQSSPQHSMCLRELDALKVLHDKWSAEDYASLI